MLRWRTTGLRLEKCKASESGRMRTTADKSAETNRQSNGSEGTGTFSERHEITTAPWGETVTVAILSRLQCHTVFGCSTLRKESRQTGCLSRASLRRKNFTFQKRTVSYAGKFLRPAAASNQQVSQLAADRITWRCLCMQRMLLRSVSDHPPSERSAEASGERALSFCHTCGQLHWP